MHPGSKIESVSGSYSGALVVRVRARAVDGGANDAVINAVAASFEVAPSHVSMIRGRRSRRKFLAVEGDSESLMARYEELIAGEQPKDR